MKNSDEILKAIAKRNVVGVLKVKTRFDAFNQLVRMYDNMANDYDGRKLTEYMLNELGYEKGICGWILTDSRNCDIDEWFNQGINDDSSYE